MCFECSNIKIQHCSWSVVLWMKKIAIHMDGAHQPTISDQSHVKMHTNSTGTTTCALSISTLKTLYFLLNRNVSVSHPLHTLRVHKPFKLVKNSKSNKNYIATKLNSYFSLSLSLSISLSVLSHMHTNKHNDVPCLFVVHFTLFDSKQVSWAPFLCPYRHTVSFLFIFFSLYFVPVLFGLLFAFPHIVCFHAQLFDTFRFPLST